MGSKFSSGFATVLAVILAVVGLALIGAAYLGTRERPNSPSPSSSSTPTPDPTANWKTYTSTRLGVSFKYPDSYLKYVKEGVDIYLAPSAGVLGEANGTPMGLTENDFWVDISTQSGTNLSSIDDLVKGNNAYFNAPKTKILIGNLPGYKISHLEVVPPTVSVDYRGVVLKEGVVYNISLSAFKKEVLLKNEETFDQILSTFKFFGASPTPTCRPRPACLDATPRCLIPETPDMCPPASRACTMEAKLCPDGSYVARTGPNCEFAPCPSP